MIISNRTTGVNYNYAFKSYRNDCMPVVIDDGGKNIMVKQMGQLVLTMNCGGSSIKYKLFEMNTETVIAEGNIQGFGASKGRIVHKVQGMAPFIEEKQVNDHQAGLQIMLDHLFALELFQKNTPAPTGDFLIVHKIADGGNRMRHVEMIDANVEAAIEEMAVVAAVHNPPMLQAIRATRVIAPGIPQLAVFETGFHRTIPEYASVYGLPYELAEQYGLRKYGFHGASHQYISQKVPDILGRSPMNLKLISIHLGSGTSVAAIKDGVSLDVSSGFTPQSGTMMSTRAGDFDPEVLYFLLENKILSLAEIREMLNNRAGLAGISGIPGGEIREIEKAAITGNQQAQLALDAFCYGIRKFIGSFAVALQGIDVISFTGGIGEHDPIIRSQVCRGLEWLGIDLDEQLNVANPETGIISQTDSRVKIVVLPTNEELVVARQAIEFWRN